MYSSRRPQCWNIMTYIHQVGTVTEHNWRERYASFCFCSTPLVSLYCICSLTELADFVFCFPFLHKLVCPITYIVSIIFVLHRIDVFTWACLMNMFKCLHREASTAPVIPIFFSSSHGPCSRGMFSVKKAVVQLGPNSCNEAILMPFNLHGSTDNECSYTIKKEDSSLTRLWCLYTKGSQSPSGACEFIQVPFR